MGGSRRLGLVRTLNELAAGAATLGVPLSLVLKSELGHQVLRSLAGVPHLVLQGGGAVHHVFGSPRFSADLDFAQQPLLDESAVGAALHDAADVAVALPTPIDAPVAQKNGTKITAKLPAYAGAALYEAIALVQLSRDARRVFRITVEPDAIGDTLDVVPDLSSVTGYSAEWNLPTDEDVLVSARAHETPAALADGMRTRTAARGIVLTP